jgi:hypothetical protein
MNKCPECGADWSGGETCTDQFYTMLAWELDHQLYDVHHLMVIAYNLQHPSVYSPQTLEDVKGMLVAFLEQGVTPQQMRQKIKRLVDSSVRTHKITGTAEAHGEHAQPVTWTMTAFDVTAAGIEQYYASVRAWAWSVLRALRESGNMA